VRLLRSSQKRSNGWDEAAQQLVRTSDQISAMFLQGLKLFRNGLGLLVLLAVPAMSNAFELKQETVNAWNDYLRMTNLRTQRKLGMGGPFLWTDKEPGQRERVRRGKILVSPAGKTSPQKVRDGLIHDWIGVIFIPSVTIKEVFAVVHDYDRYKCFYKSTIIDSKLLGRIGEQYEFWMLGLKGVLFEKIAIEGQSESHCSQVDETRRYCVSDSTRLQEIKDYGEPNQGKLPIDEGHGYIWRLYSLAKFEERDDGVYLEVEAIALSRDISLSVRWVTKPVVERMSRNSIYTILERTREAVQSNVAAYSQRPAREPQPGNPSGPGIYFAPCSRPIHFPIRARSWLLGVKSTRNPYVRVPWSMRGLIRRAEPSLHSE
jgi:hypothetical protein